MDPICHTLFGAALGSTGLKHKTRFGSATLILGANLPDIDVMSYCWGETAALEVRRGSTHGILALLTLPVLLAGSMMLLGRAKQPKKKNGVRSGPALDFKWLLALSTLSAISHPVLDFLNVYGVRWLMPFDASWFYGDILYIVDPWMWGILTGALLFARRHRSRPVNGALSNPASLGILITLSYICAMAVGAFVSRDVVATQLPGSDQLRMMIAPVPIDPFRRTVVIDESSTYRTGVVELLPRPRFHLDADRIPKGDHPAFDRAALTARGRRFLSWARFPFFELDESTDPPTVYILDARYTLTRDATFGAIRIPLPR